MAIASIIVGVVAGDIPFSGPILRLIDANANRAREALRVWRITRALCWNQRSFARTSRACVTSCLQSLRPWLEEAIVHRDTPGDVGTTIKTASEQSRPDLAAVIIAAAKRAGEAMRAIEEFLKTANPTDAARVESNAIAFTISNGESC